MAELKLVAPPSAAQEPLHKSVLYPFLVYCRCHPTEFFASEELGALERVLQRRSRHWGMDRIAHIMERLSLLRQQSPEEREDLIAGELALVSCKGWLKQPLDLFIFHCKRKYSVEELPLTPERERYLRAAFIIFLTTS